MDLPTPPSNSRGGDQKNKLLQHKKRCFSPTYLSTMPCKWVANFW